MNIGPFSVDTDGDVGAARDSLTQLEQLRWVLGGLLESKDLPALWPFRVIQTASEKTNPMPQFVLQNGCYLLLTAPGERLPLGQVAGILLDDNTPRLPDEVETGLRKLFDTLSARGSRVTWGGPPSKPDLAWARMQLFATKFEYSSSFHILFNALQGGTDLRAAEQNAFGKDSKTLESEAAAVLSAGQWQPVSVSGRPLDPRRDFGEHSVDPVVVDAYAAFLRLQSDPSGSVAAFKAAAEAGGAAAPLGFSGLAQIAVTRHQDPEEFLEKAIQAGSRNATTYLDASENALADERISLLKKAASLNPLWGEPLFRQAALASDPAEKEDLLKKAVHLSPRETKYWLELAQVQSARGEATSSQSSWLRAEDSAPTAAERERIHDLRVGSEQARLDAADQARRQERESEHLADEQAQQAELDRVRAAEQRANQALDAASGTEKPADVVPWSAVTPQRKIQGSLVRVECLHSAKRLTIKDKAGTVIQLLLRESSAPDNLSCGVETHPRRVVAGYSAAPDASFGTAGEITSLEVR